MLARHATATPAARIAIAAGHHAVIPRCSECEPMDQRLHSIHRRAPRVTELHRATSVIDVRLRSITEATGGHCTDMLPEVSRIAIVLSATGALTARSVIDRTREAEPWLRPCTSQATICGNSMYSRGFRLR